MYDVRVYIHRKYGLCVTKRVINPTANGFRCSHTLELGLCMWHRVAVARGLW